MEICVFKFIKSASHSLNVFISHIIFAAETVSLIENLFKLYRKPIIGTTVQHEFKKSNQPVKETLENTGSYQSKNKHT